MSDIDDRPDLFDNLFAEAYSAEGAPRDDAAAFGSYDPNSPARPTRTYTTLDQAYDTFKHDLFDGKLPTCLITMQRTRAAYGYFSGGRFVRTDDPDEITDEIALNPIHFQRQTSLQVLSTLLHEMVHLWQFHFGKPGRGRYHNREWARKMLAVGLVPSDTGQPGGKMTGERVSHYIREGGPFDQLCRQRLVVDGTVLFQDRAYREEADDDGAVRSRERKTASKTKYACPNPDCPQVAWAKPAAQIICARCDERMLP